MPIKLLSPRPPSPPTLGDLGEKILEHWKEFRPQTVAQLQKEGNLLPVIYDLQQSARRQLADLQARGLNQIEAQELVYPQIFPKGETEEP